MQNNLKIFLNRKYKEYLKFVGQADKRRVLVVMMASLAITMGVTLASISTSDAETTNVTEVNYTEVQEEVYAEMRAATLPREETTTKQTTTTSTTSTTTSTSTTTTTSATTSTTTTTATTTETTTTESTTTTDEVVTEAVTEVVYSGVGQYGYAIDPEEYVYLAEVIEHEGGNCPLYVKEHIGICLLNRVFVPGFKDSVYGCKEQSGQYFSGYYPFSDESAELAKTMIAAYNSGGDYWSQYCLDRGLNCRTKYQRNDFCVPGTTYVNDDNDCTSGGYWFHMYYSE